MKEIARARVKVEDFSPCIATTLSGEETQRQFYGGYGGSEGKPFTYWTETRVYFPVVYDGSEWVESVPRDPCDEATFHVGGG